MGREEQPAHRALRERVGRDEPPAHRALALARRLSPRLRLGAQALGLRLRLGAMLRRGSLPALLGALDGASPAEARVPLDTALGALDAVAERVRAVGGSLLYFIESGTEEQVWEQEFVPAPATQATPGLGLAHVDHIAQTMRYDEFLSWLLYWMGIPFQGNMADYRGGSDEEMFYWSFL